MAKVLNVDISVVAPEKSIVPWACGAVANVSAISVGVNARVAQAKDCFDRRWAAPGLQSEIDIACKQFFFRIRLYSKNQ